MIRIIFALGLGVLILLAIHVFTSSEAFKSLYTFVDFQHRNLTSITIDQNNRLSHDRHIDTDQLQTHIDKKIDDAVNKILNASQFNNTNPN